jgi:chromosome segregation ATPase
MSTRNEQAALLAEQAANALAAARTSLSIAADVTDEVDSVLRRSENDIYELPTQARLVRDTDDPQRHLRNAQGAAEDIERRLRNGQAGLVDVRDHLDQGARALDAGRQILTELEQLPGQQGEATDRLRSRLDGLGRAVRDAGEGVEEAGKRLAAARSNIEPLIYQSTRIDDPHRTAAVIGDAGANVQNDVMAVQRRLAGLRQGFDAARPEATAAAQQSADLAMAARAAMNPTPASAQRRSAGSSEMDPRRRNAEQALGPDHER